MSDPAQPDPAGRMLALSGGPNQVVSEISSAPAVSSPIGKRATMARLPRQQIRALAAEIIPHRRPSIEALRTGAALRRR